MATTEEEQLLVQSFGSMATDILAGNRSPYLAKFAPPGPPEELMQAAWQAQAGNLPKFPSPSNGNLVYSLVEQGLPPAKAMSAGMGALKENVNKQLVEEEIKRQTEVAAVTEGLAQALAAEYPQTMLEAWGLPGIPDVAKEASKFFGTNPEEVKNKVRTIGYGAEIDAVTAAQVIESSWEGTAYEYKPTAAEKRPVVEKVSVERDPDVDVVTEDDEDDDGGVTVVPEVKRVPRLEFINGIWKQWYDLEFGDEEALAGLEEAGLSRSEAGETLAIWQQTQFDEGWLNADHRPGVWTEDWVAGTLSESKARRLLERYYTLSNGIFGLRTQTVEGEINKTIGDYLTAWTRYARHKAGMGSASSPAEKLARYMSERKVLEGEGAGDEPWITRQIERLPAREQYMTAAGNALGPRVDDPTVKSYLNDRYSYEYGSYWLRGALNAGDLWVPSMLEGQEKWSRHIDRGFDPQEASLYRNKEDIDTGWRNLVEASSPSAMSAEVDYAEDPAKYAYGRIARSDSIQVAAAMAKAGLTGQGVRGKMKLRGFNRILDEYNQERAYKTTKDADERLASFLARKYGGVWA